MGKKKKVSGKEKESESPAVNVSVEKPQDFEAKSAKDEIDAIFGKKKRKAVPEQQEVVTGDRPPSLSKKRRKKLTSPDDGEGRRKAGKESKGGIRVEKLSSAAEHSVKPRKRTEDGLTVYGEDELKWNSKNAGGTRLCPFDCDCCF